VEHLQFPQRKAEFRAELAVLKHMIEELPRVQCSGEILVR